MKNRLSTSGSLPKLFILHFFVIFSNGKQIVFENDFCQEKVRFYRSVAALFSINKYFGSKNALFSCYGNIMNAKHLQRTGMFHCQ